MELQQANRTTSQFAHAIRQQLEMFMSTDDLPRLTPKVNEPHDTRNHIEVAFALDQILQRPHDEAAGRTSCEQHY